MCLLGHQITLGSVKLGGELRSPGTQRQRGDGLITSDRLVATAHRCQASDEDEEEAGPSPLRSPEGSCAASSAGEDVQNHAQGMGPVVSEAEEMVHCCPSDLATGKTTDRCEHVAFSNGREPVIHLCCERWAT